MKETCSTYEETLDTVSRTHIFSPESTTPTGLVCYTLAFKANNRLVHIRLNQTEYRDYSGSYVFAILKKELPHVILLRNHVDPFVSNYVDIFNSIERWCEKNCSGLWMPRSKVEFLFQNYSDAVAVKLRMNGQEFVNEEE